MSTRERPIDRGTERARRILADLGRELRTSRRDRALSLAAVGLAGRMSASKVSRIERGLSPSVTVVDLARLHAVVGLELWARSFQGGSPIRDAGSVKVLSRLRECLHPELDWSLEVPFRALGDQRAWDAVIVGRYSAWRFGVEVETAPRDVQALARRLGLKLRDGDVDGILLVLPRSKHTSAFLGEAGRLMASGFPVSGPDALRALRAGVRPRGSAIVVI
jgi:transcriptional regulator with XRE-family HTH domain